MPWKRIEPRTAGTNGCRRALTGTWVLGEIWLAVPKGYVLVEVQILYEYRVTHYDPQTGAGGLFVQYINTCMKLNSEASGYPNWVQSQGDEDRYIGEIAASEGIQLDKGATGANCAKRSLAKPCLNSMWGKLS